MNRNKTFAGILLLGFVVCAASCGREASPGSGREKQTQLTLGTIVQVDVCYEAAQEQRLSETYRKVWSLLAERTRAWNGFDRDSEVSKINQSYPQAVAVSPETRALLELSQQVSAATGGAFDVTVKPLLDLWRSAAAKGQTPQEEDLAVVMSAVGADKVILSKKGTVRLAGPLTRIDLGGIAKGFAVDEVAALLRQEGFPNFLIDAGGDMYAGGMNCRGLKWRVGVRDPDSPDRIREVLLVSDRAVTTSGSYEQHWEVGGKSFSHILDPVSGRPLAVKTNGDKASVTVVTSSAAWGDGLSTAFSVWPVVKSLEYAEQEKQSPLAVLIFLRQGQKTPLQRVASRDVAEYQRR